MTKVKLHIEVEYNDQTPLDEPIDMPSEKIQQLILKLIENKQLILTSVNTKSDLIVSYGIGTKPLMGSKEKTVEYNIIDVG